MRMRDLTFSSLYFRYFSTDFNRFFTKIRQKI